MTPNEINDDARSRWILPEGLALIAKRIATVRRTIGFGDGASTFDIPGVKRLGGGDE